MPDDDGRVRVTVSTEHGEIVCAIDLDRAPVTAANFLAHVDGGYLDGVDIYRIATLANQARPDHRIEVVQWGYSMEPGSGPLPRIVHEPTGTTGLRHRRGTLSMARREAGTAGPGFFFCVGGDLASLDEGGGRHSDGLGFAAFGEVVEGMDVLDAILATAPAETEWPATPSRIETVRRG